jgi:hypothetical protein
MAANRYYRLLLRGFADLNDAARDVLPVNRMVVNEFINSGQVYFINVLLSSIENTEQYDHFDWESDETFNYFKEYILRRELVMKRMLIQLWYYINEENTLTLVAGDDRPETVRTRLSICHFFVAHML